MPLCVCVCVWTLLGYLHSPSWACSGRRCVRDPLPPAMQECQPSRLVLHWISRRMLLPRDSHRFRMQPSRSHGGPNCKWCAARHGKQAQLRERKGKKEEEGERADKAEPELVRVCANWQGICIIKAKHYRTWVQFVFKRHETQHEHNSSSNNNDSSNNYNKISRFALAKFLHSRKFTIYTKLYLCCLFIHIYRAVLPWMQLAFVARLPLFQFICAWKQAMEICKQFRLINSDLLFNIY